MPFFTAYLVTISPYITLTFRPSGTVFTARGAASAEFGTEFGALQKRKHFVAA